MDVVLTTPPRKNLLSGSHGEYQSIYRVLGPVKKNRNILIDRVNVFYKKLQAIKWVKIIISELHIFSTWEGKRL
jgi:hypothetical protein